ncbi:MAG: MBL fold metallo-hydrolase [Propionibacteriaceae bacterium]|jgi:glyoxylase-like metal-dependent hydrolase (beta-lactamase superfamily II)|nr:MBL fold metallo-hydrolase [Propionibacteriaceae bacterium]
MGRIPGITIHEIGSYVVRNYLLETPVGIIAVDTGYSGGFAKFKDRFEKKWPLSALRYIFVTHHHDDHVGFLGDLVASTQATVVLHQSASEYIANGRNNMPPGGGYSSLPGSLFGLVKKDFSFPPLTLPADRVVTVASQDDQVFESLGLPIRVLLLPGHTDDSIGLWLPQTGIILCGDAAMNAVISVARHTIWIDDTAEFGRSWDKMVSYHPKLIYPAHGNPFEASDLAKYRHYLDGKQLIPPK